MKTVIRVFTGALVLALWAAFALAGPTFTINGKNAWVGAVNSGQIQPVISWNGGWEYHFPGEAASLRTPNLEPMADVDPISPGKQAGLVMAWGDVGDDGIETIAAWLYDLGQEENMLNSVIDLTGNSPCATISSVGFTLIDADGKSMAYRWPVLSAFPCDVNVPFSVNPYLGASGSSITPVSFYEEPGFDLTRVVAMTFDERGTWDGSAASDPAGFGQHVWNTWRSVAATEVVPAEAATWGHIKALYE